MLLRTISFNSLGKEDPTRNYPVEVSPANLVTPNEHASKRGSKKKQTKK